MKKEKNKKETKKVEKTSDNKLSIAKVIMNPKVLLGIIGVLFVTICVLVAVFVLKDHFRKNENTNSNPNQVIDKEKNDNVEVKDDKKETNQTEESTEKTNTESSTPTQSTSNSSSNTSNKNSGSQNNSSSSSNTNTTPKTDTKKTTQPNVSYSCGAGYDLNGTVCSKTETINANVEYYCDEEGYNYNGYNCEKNVVYTVPNISRKQCDAYPGTYNHLSGSCSVPKTYTKDASVRYLCPSGYDVDNTFCTKTTTVDATPNYTCPNGYTLNGNICEK